MCIKIKHLHLFILAPVMQKYYYFASICVFFSLSFEIKCFACENIKYKSSSSLFPSWAAKLPRQIECFTLSLFMPSPPSNNERKEDKRMSWSWRKSSAHHPPLPASFPLYRAFVCDGMWSTRGFNISFFKYYAYTYLKDDAVLTVYDTC